MLLLAPPLPSSQAHLIPSNDQAASVACNRSGATNLSHATQAQHLSLKNLLTPQARAATFAAAGSRNYSFHCFSMLTTANRLQTH